MGQLLNNVQSRMKNSSAHFFIFVLKLVSGLVLGLTFALIGQEMMGFGQVSFVFVILATTGALLRVGRSWGLMGIVVFDLIFILIGLILRMYILIAPGA